MVSKKAKNEMAAGAIGLFVSILSNPETQNQLAKAPKAAVDWAKQRREKEAPTPTKEELKDPKGHFGQKGLERRVFAMRKAVELALPEDDRVGRQQLLDMIDEVDRAVQMAAGLPFMKRQKAHRRIDEKLDAMEHALVDAMLPKK